MTVPARTALSPRATLLRPGLILAGVLLIATNLRAAITSLGPVLGIVQDDQGLSSVAASVLVSVPLIAFATFSPIAPKVAAKVGLEHALGAALLLLAVGIVLRSTPPQPLLWAGTALLGVAIATVNVLLPALVKRDFPARIGPVTGVYTAAQSGVAAIAAGIAVPLAGQQSGGWRLSLGVWAGLAVLALGVFAPRLRRFTRIVTPSAGPGASGTRSPWRSALAWQVTLFMGLQSLAFYVLLTWLPSIERVVGISSAAAGFHQLLFNLSGLLGSLLCSALVHRLPDQRPIAIGGSLLLMGALTGLLLAPGIAVIWAVIAGFSIGITLTLALSLFGLRTRHYAEAGALSGMAQAAGYTLAALGPIAIGAVHDATASWTPALAILVALVVVQTVFGALASRPKTL
ncbi:MULTISPECIES: MFS transporter [unclassified Amycolatopsis]|uniref:MFS transporter n=1 Tax=unclassified Amycolatopsis TaxID=2618356 RepID=UPI002E146297|nr:MULTISPECIES: MFS transporter [unclassified Amycolatopsis]WSJ81119.1 MFS transporter [Amycolatopsis sp. NBC_01307]WSK75461.1 MFS transporter [Amycolatopsis sp. NBC_01286]